MEGISQRCDSPYTYKARGQPFYSDVHLGPGDPVESKKGARSRPARND